MNKLATDGNMFPRLGRLYRLICYVIVFIISICVFDIVHRIFYHQHFYELRTTSLPALPYNRYIDREGNYLPSFGYEILQLVKNPISLHFTELNNFLSGQPQLLEYFTMVLPKNYHVTITDLVNRTAYDEKSLALLIDEQLWLDKFDTAVTCYGKELSIIEQYELRLEILFIRNYDTEKLKEYQKRWTKQIPSLIARHRTSYYLTLAYQYKDIPSQKIFDELNGILKEWQQCSVEIELDPIEICLHYDLSNYTAILPEQSRMM